MLVWNQEFLFTDGGNANWYSHFERQLGDFSQKQKYHVTQYQCLLVQYLSKAVEKLMFTQKPVHECFEQLFHNCKIWKLPRCLSIDKWINKFWYIQGTSFRAKKKRYVGHKGTLKVQYSLKKASLKWPYDV